MGCDLPQAKREWGSGPGEAGQVCQEEATEALHASLLWALGQDPVARAGSGRLTDCSLTTGPADSQASPTQDLGAGEPVEPWLAH